MAEFSPAIEIVLKNEGGYVNDPQDPGGETNFGISKASHPNVDIKNLSKEDAKYIYYNEYWLPNRLNEIQNQNVANFALDTLVHHGQGARILQDAVNTSGGDTIPDNKMGPHTIASINAQSPAYYLQNAIKGRIAYMEKLAQNDPSLGKFLTGWKIRAGFFLIRPYIAVGSIIAGTALLYYLIKKT